MNIKNIRIVNCMIFFRVTHVVIGGFLFKLEFFATLLIINKCFCAGHIPTTVSLWSFIVFFGFT